MNYKLVAVLLLFLFCGNQGFTQTKTEIESLKNLFQTDTQTHHWTKELKNNTNEIQLILSAMFVFYKEYISSQDLATCAFTPSCSVYAIQSIKHKGLIIGVLAAFDRLARCNTFSREQYSIDESTKKLKDQVE